MSPSSAIPKKRRTDSNSTQPTKKHKTHGTVDVKGKAKSDSEFQVVSATLQVSVPPAFAQSPRVGVEQMLDSLVMRYIPSLEGVVIAHSNLDFTADKARIKGDCPFLICDIKFDATVWKPRIGSTMKGRIILSSPDHISLLVHRTFNVSIPRHHIPSSQWEFEYGPAENDPEFAQEAEAEADENEDGEDEEASTGKWVHRKTGERLGGESRTLEFTVIGLTVANEMLSLVGSIQKDPLSSKHQPFQSTAPTKQAANDEDGVEEQLSEDEDNDSASEEEDTMRLLKRKAVAAPVVEEAPEKDKSSKSSKKKKRKTES
ncbi:hypothetical protein BKA70DRAFT_1260398 [Coprinopsis sp. MPI-PUGE-AT-0042]|nr:hypothetical protein BKA70DRAFT_1260398 [Coprinopsis sp. MPI-PUGE-AT-0042]